MNKIHIWKEDPVLDAESATVSVILEIPGEGRKRLWYRMPSGVLPLTAEQGDPFVLASLFAAMRRQTDVHVHDAVSPSLLKNLEEFQSAWVRWRSNRYSMVEIGADRETEQEVSSAREGALAVFSGGVDSAFTFFHSMKGMRKWRQDLKAGLMVHGFDIPLERASAFSGASERGRAMLKSLGVDLITVATNFRELDDIWEDAHGAGLASCLALLQRGFSRGVISSSDPYDNLLLPFGSNPLTDRMFSSDSFPIVNYGGGFSRDEKVRAISKWPEALKFLRVCWENKKDDSNCGVCEKCVRTILNFRIAGAGLPECFERDVTDAQIDALSGLNIGQLDELEKVLLAARQSGLAGSWVSALERCTKRNRQDLSRGNILTRIARRLSVRRAARRLLTGFEQARLER